MNAETNGNYRCFYICLFRLYVIIPKLSPPSISSGIRVAPSLVFCVVFNRLLFLLLSFHFMFSVLLRFTYLQTLHSTATFYWSACTNPINWAVVYLCVRGLIFPVSAMFLLDLGTVPTVCHFWVFHFIIKLITWIFQPIGGYYDGVIHYWTNILLLLYFVNHSYLLSDLLFHFIFDLSIT